ncbi:hypothetical protein ABH917_004429 [Thermobifida halotolerans]
MNERIGKRISTSFRPWRPVTRWPDARQTSDIDLMRTETVPTQELVADHNAALGLDYGDHLVFVPRDVELMGNGTTARIQHSVYLGGEELMEIGNDVVLPDPLPLRKPPETTGFPTHIHPSGDERENPDLPLISTADTLAHKAAGMYTRHWQGGPPTGSKTWSTLFSLLIGPAGTVPRSTPSSAGKWSGGASTGGFWTCSTTSRYPTRRGGRGSPGTRSPRRDSRTTSGIHNGEQGLLPPHRFPVDRFSPQVTGLPGKTVPPARTAPFPAPGKTPPEGTGFPR